MEAKILKQLQDTETEILANIDLFCKKNNIKYSLYYGTALGAVRHKGFIPWDDDLDIAMTRDNYELFCTLWKKNPLKGFFLQTIETDSYSGVCHAKVRKDNTLFISEDGDGNNIHNGIWIDIFALDRVPKNVFKKAYLYFNNLKRMIYTRGYSISSKDSLLKKILKSFLKIIPDSYRKDRLIKSEKNIQKYINFEGDYTYKSFATLGSIKYDYSKELVSNYVYTDFENHKFLIFKDSDSMLKILYGDYMKLPPVEEQVSKHNPKKIEFNVDS